VGYNKNVCKFVSKAREYAKGNGGTITFVSNNTYENTPESLGECFERNAEGMLKNMAIHELALLVSFYDVTVENIESCVADATFSSCQTLFGPSSGKGFTDFDEIKFTITTKTGKTVSVQADRCGGDTSWKIVMGMRYSVIPCRMKMIRPTLRYWNKNILVLWYVILSSPVFFFDFSPFSCPSY
jgi:predicted dehydrogenase